MSLDRGFRCVLPLPDVPDQRLYWQGARGGVAGVTGSVSRRAPGVSAAGTAGGPISSMGRDRVSCPCSALAQTKKKRYATHIALPFLVYSVHLPTCGAKAGLGPRGQEMRDVRCRSAETGGEEMELT